MEAEHQAHSAELVVELAVEFELVAVAEVEFEVEFEFAVAAEPVAVAVVVEAEAQRLERLGHKRRSAAAGIGTLGTAGRRRPAGRMA